MNYGKQAVRDKQRSLNSKGIKWGRNLSLNMIRLGILVAIGAFICFVTFLFGAFNGLLATTPNISLDDVVASGKATIVYDCEGHELDKYISSDSNRIEVTMDQVPKHLADAFVAIEDERFYQHNGIDYKAILRSGFQYFKSDFNQTQGGSTITQQLLKNTIFTDWTSEGKNMVKKLKRKLQEQYLALKLTEKFSKEETLLAYMNAINLGQSTLGVEAASRRYFNKSCSQLTLSEATVIAVITQNPSGYNPIRHPEKNKERRQVCLDKMVELGFINETQYNEALADTDDVYERISECNIKYTESQSDKSRSASYFSDAVYEQVRDDLIAKGYPSALAEKMLSSRGLIIESTLDPKIQSIADEEFANPNNFPKDTDLYLDYALTIKVGDSKYNFSKEQMTTWFKNNKKRNFNLIFKSQEDAQEAIDLYRTTMLSELSIEDDPDNYEESINLTKQPQAAMVIEDQKSGYVVAIVGGRGEKTGRRTLNRATGSARQPGSCFKVLASFAPAMDCAGKTLASVYNDSPFKYDDGTPVHNWYGNKYLGICTIRDAIERSLNVIAVKNLTVVTPQVAYDYLINFGFTTLEEGSYYNGKWYSDINQPMALGGLTRGVTPFELNGAYAAIANNGEYHAPKLYKRVYTIDRDGNEKVILDNTEPASKQVLKPQTAYLLTLAMEDVVTGKNGTGSMCKLDNMPVAGKTGTTTDTHDIWFAGYTPYYTCSVWAGYDNNVTLSKSDTAKKLWKAVMARIHEELPRVDFEEQEPEGIVQCYVCPQSGLLAIDGVCPSSHKEYFAEGTQPTERCNVHYQGAICEYCHLKAQPNCPFQYEGVTQLPLIEDDALLTGSGRKSQPSTYCPHTDQFLHSQDAAAKLADHQNAINQARAAAAAAAQENNQE